MAGAAGVWAESGVRQEEPLWKRKILICHVKAHKISQQAVQ